MTRDYYSVLLRAASALDPNTEQARRAVYDRARQAMMDANLPSSELDKERSALEAAISRIETETEQATARPAPMQRRQREALPGATGDAAPDRQQQPRAKGATFSPLMLALLAAFAVLVIGVVGYAFWPQGGFWPRGSVVTVRGASQKQEAVPVADVAGPKTVDRSRASDLSYIFKRQLVYYRTIHPVGTIVIAKSQRFLYLIRPNVAAMRYTVGVGRECMNLVGLLLVSGKEEWAERPPTANETPRPSGQPNGSVSRFGVRSLSLGETGHRIHGTYASGTAGESGCFPLVNDDIIDLYDRVHAGTRVVIN